MMMIIIF